MYNLNEEIYDFAQDLDSLGYIYDEDIDDISNVDLIADELRVEDECDDIRNWLNDCVLREGNDVAINSMIVRLNVIEMMKSDVGVNVLNMLVDALPQVQPYSARSHEHYYGSAESEKCVCVRTEEEAETIADMLEALSRESGYDTNFGTNEPDENEDSLFHGWYTVYQVD